MADEQDIPMMETDIEPRPAAIGRPSLIGRINVLLILTAIVALECILAYFMMPGPAEVAAQVDEPAAEQEKEEEEEPLPPEGYVPDDPLNPDLSNYTEIELGEPFTITARQPDTNTTIRLDFHLFGTVEKDQEEEVVELLEERNVRVRDQIRTIFLEADTEDLTDPLLGLIKRQVLAKTNRILGDRYLKSVAFSDFNYVEQ